MIEKFSQFDLSAEMMRSLEKMEFSTPTPVQAATIEPMKAHCDLLVQAPTGTGKTGAFGIPAVEAVDPDNRNVQAVILCPTRELAVQTAVVIRDLCAYKHGVRTLALYGGEPIYRQITALRKNPQIIVATPGRLIDHMNRRTVKFKHIKLVVLDEADRMLDMGFRDDMKEILEHVPQERQTVLFSATISDEIKKLAAEYQSEPQQITIQSEAYDIARIEQYYSEVRQGEKTTALIELLNEKEFDQVLVFVGTRIMADTLAKELSSTGYSADVIHGALRQSQRDQVMRKYRSGKVKVLVATDVAARGIDVSNIDAVINYDIPEDPASYTHRVGRTGRAGQSGVAYTFIYRKEQYKLRIIITETKAVIQPINGATAIEMLEKPRGRSFDRPFGKSRGAAQKSWQPNRQKRGQRKGGSSYGWKKKSA